MTGKVRDEALQRADSTAVIVADEAGVVRSWSTGAEAMFGYRTDEAIGRTVAELIVPPSFRDAHLRGLERFVAGEPPTRLDGQYTVLAQHHSGELGPVNLLIAALPSPLEHWSIGILTRLDDTTPTNLLSDDIISTLFDRAPEAITLLDTSGRQITVNAAGAKMMGMGDAGRHPGDGHGFVHPDDRERTGAHFADVQAGRLQPDAPLRYRVLRADGSWLWMETVLADLTDVPAVGGYVAFTRDVTEDEERRLELVEAHRTAAEASERSSELAHARLAFAASTSHELRTPLSSISSAIEALLAEPIGTFAPDHRTYLRLIARNAKRLARLVEDLLAYSRLEAGQLGTRRDAVDPLQVVHDAIAEIESLADERGLRIDVTMSDGPVVQGDEDQIRQIVDNVLGNAVKFAHPVSTIDVDCDHDGRGWFITISDVGPKIDPADVDVIFEPFVRLEATERASQGSGLGLPIARGLAELHGGSLTCDPTHSNGAKFSIFLPTN